MTHVEITAELVWDLVRDQHPDLADRSVRLGARGWDNQLWRLGDDLAVRLPWATGSADALLRKEHSWLPTLAPRQSPSRSDSASPPNGSLGPGSSPPGFRAHLPTGPPSRVLQTRPDPWPLS